MMKFLANWLWLSPTTILLFSIISILFIPDIEAAKVRIKDIAAFQDRQEIELFGYGLVVGLDGTGDGSGTQFTNRSLANMMERMGLTIDARKMKVKNVAAVIVTAVNLIVDILYSRLDPRIRVS